VKRGRKIGLEHLAAPVHAKLFEKQRFAHECLEV